MAPPRELVRAGLDALGVERFVLGIHDASFPADPDEDAGRGTPYAAAGHRFLAFAASLGFDGIQMGPQGQTSVSNPSPYDGALFSREVMGLALRPLAEDPSWGGLLAGERIAALAAATPPGAAARADHAHAFAARRAALAEAFRTFVSSGSAAVRERRRRLAEYERANAYWLEPDGLYEALSAEHRTGDWRAWPEKRPTAELMARHAEALRQHAFGQYALAEQHAALRRHARAVGLRLYGDLQVGVSWRDRWTRAGLFLDDYVMGAPPSRTNPDGQAWGYPVLDPGLYFDGAGDPGPAQRFVATRLDRLLADFDGVRVDHPHGLVTPWVYRKDAADALAAVQGGARLFASPDLPDHPGLARWSIVGPDQIDRSLPRHHDDWVRDLTTEQVDRYGVLLDVVLEQSRRHGREASDVLLEVLSTWPSPLRAVMRRHGLGRFYVTQKADPTNAGDVYRTANASPEDWVMVGSHDTPTLWSLAGEWAGRERGAQWARYLAARLEPRPAERAPFAARVSAHPGLLAEAMLADLFVGPARHVSVFFADLFGMTERYNVPGTVGPQNWTLRVPADFERTWAERRERRAALDPARAVALAVRARLGEAGAPLAERLDADSVRTG